MLEVLQGTIDTNKDPSVFRVYNAWGTIKIDTNARIMDRNKHG